MTHEVIHERLKRIRSIWVLDENGDYIYDSE